MKRALCTLLVAFGILAGIHAQSDTSQAHSLLESTEEVLREITQIRNLAPKAEIKKGIKTRDEIRGYLLDRINEEYPPEEIEAEARLLKRLGLIPPDMELRSFMLDFLTEQIAGFYDPKTKTFYIAEWIPVELQKPVMAHELTHAIQDQYFDLEKYLSRAEGNEDRSLAQAAVVEGEGLLVMLAYTLGPFGRGIEDLDILELNRAQMPMLEAQYPTFARAPAYLRETLLFPYTYGANFVQKFIQQRGWGAMTELYEDFPRSSEQVLHPEKFFRYRDDPSEIAALESEPSREIIFQSVMGELGILLWLRTGLTEERSELAATGWDGDRVALSVDGGNAEVLLMETRWDSEDEAEEFVEAVRSLLNARWGAELVWSDAGSASRASEAGGAAFQLSRQGSTVLYEERDRFP